MGEKQTPRVNMEDLDFLREQPTPKLRRWRSNNRRSIKELTDYNDCIAVVLKERGAETGPYGG